MVTGTRFKNSGQKTQVKKRTKNERKKLYKNWRGRSGWFG